jgi:2-keto-3-deoxy-L-rhamnonate aldolase RhmA
VRNEVRVRLRAGEPTLGCFMGLGSPNVAELLGHVGFDWLVIETEHSGLDAAEVERMLMALSGSASVPLVRVPPRDPVSIQRALDLGAMGVVVPLVRSADEARDVVSATRYPPEGGRSFGPLRAARYSLDYGEYLDSANENMLVVLILETAEAVADLEAIASTPGVDVLYFGLFDLCLSLGLDPRRLPLPEIDTLTERALEIGRSRGIAIGMGARTPEELVSLRDKGFAFLGYATDYFLLLDAAKRGIEALGHAAPAGGR